MTPAWSSDQLIALCASGYSERISMALQEPATAKVALRYDDILVDAYVGTPPKQLVLERMLGAAAKAGHVTAVDVLVTFGQQNNVAVDDLLTTATIYAALEANALPILQRFEAVKPDIFTCYVSPGYRVLELACYGGPTLEPKPRNSYLPLVQYMMEKKLDPNLEIIAQRRGPGYLLYLSTRYASLSIVKCLLEHGVQVAESRSVRAAAARDRVDVLEALLQHGADLGECYADEDLEGPAGTALHVAVAANKSAAVEFLLQHNVNATRSNSDGKTAFDVVPRHGGKAIKNLLGCN